MLRPLYRVFLYVFIVATVWGILLSGIVDSFIVKQFGSKILPGFHSAAFSVCYLNLIHLSFP